MRETENERQRHRWREREIVKRERVYGTPEAGECIIIKIPSASAQFILVPVRVPGRGRRLFLL